MSECRGGLPGAPLRERKGKAGVYVRLDGSTGMFVPVRVRPCRSAPWRGSNGKVNRGVWA